MQKIEFTEHELKSLRDFRMDFDVSKFNDAQKEEIHRKLSILLDCIKQNNL